MVCLGLEPGAAGWKAQTNPLSYGGTPRLRCCLFVFQHQILMDNLSRLYCCKY